MQSKLSLIGFTLLFLFSCSSKEKNEKFSLDYEKYTLENGLDVILHQDKSDPIVALSIVVHVGSNREKPGRTGFAHFFEHMLFQVSENLEERAFLTKLNELGGTFNGGTWNDGTIYFEVVPNDALEKVLWMESDRMGYFINAVTEKQLEDEKPVVKNEKRQRVDNQPYGHTNEMIIKNLYPEGHPYSWTVIGALEDLQNAELADVKEFYKKYYGPNNATLVLAGDFEKANAKELIEKYFGEIKKQNDVEPLPIMIPTLSETKKLYYEDSYAKLAQIRMVFPSVDQNNNDQIALNALGSILSQGKAAPLYKNLVEDKKIVPAVNAFNNANELAGTFNITATANEGVALDDVKSAIEETLASFTEESFSAEQLERIKISQESALYTSPSPFSSISSVLGKAVQLSIGNEFSNNPTKVISDIEEIKKLTKADLVRVFNKYIKGKNHIVTSVVPKGQEKLIVTGSKIFKIIEEDISKNRGKKTVEAKNVVLKKTASSFDRTIEPPLGKKPVITVPEIWTSKLGNDLKIYGVESAELPTMQLSLRIRGGQLFDSAEKVGVANLITDMMMEGTKNKTPQELEEAIQQLGATINMFTSKEYITLTASSLSRYFPEVIKLVEEILLEPRWDEAEFSRLKQEKLTQITASLANPNSVTNTVYAKLIYGDDNVLSNPILGTEATVNRIELEDLKKYYSETFTPSNSSLHIAGDVEESLVLSNLKSIESRWEAKAVALPSYETDVSKNKNAVYFVDIPNSKQSVFRIGTVQKNDDADLYTKLDLVNTRLGGDTSGKLFQVLREDSGFTYGAYSFFQRNSQNRIFTALSSIKSNKTLAAAKTFRTLIDEYDQSFSQEDLDKTKNQLLKQQTQQFETLNNVVAMLQNISTHKLPLNYIERDQKTIQNMSLDELKSLAKDYMSFDKMMFLVTGDAKTQLEGLKELGYGDPILLDRYGNKIDAYKGKDKSTKTIKVKK